MLCVMKITQNVAYYIAGDGEAVRFMVFLMAQFTIKSFTILLVLLVVVAVVAVFEMKAILASFYGNAHNA